jgi:hypothetical protein
MRIPRSSLLLLPFLAACGGAPSQPIPVRGSATDVAAIAGNWDGTYESTDGLRRGAIDFHLQSQSDTAFGDAVMIPDGLNRQLEADAARTGQQRSDQALPRPLVIRFVQVEGGEVSGEVEKYYDPSCDCRKITVFRGRLLGDVLKGTYRAYKEQGGPPDLGEWQVRRKPAAP